jgi:hypothetical protein
MSNCRIGARTKLKPGELLRLVILDHGKNEGPYDKAEALPFEVSGVLVRETKHSYTLSWWRDPMDPEDDNTEWFVIVKSAVLQGFHYPAPKYK